MPALKRRRGLALAAVLSSAAADSRPPGSLKMKVLLAAACRLPGTRCTHDACCHLSVHLTHRALAGEIGAMEPFAPEAIGGNCIDGEASGALLPDW